MRTRLKPSKVISVSAEGNILSCNIGLPSKNTIVKAAKLPYKEGDRKQYKELSKSIARKVAEFRAAKDKLTRDNNNLKKLVNKHSMTNVDNMFKKLIEINREDE